MIVWVSLTLQHSINVRRTPFQFVFFVAKQLGKRAAHRMGILKFIEVSDDVLGKFGLMKATQYAYG